MGFTCPRQDIKCEVCPHFRPDEDYPDRNVCWVSTDNRTKIDIVDGDIFDSKADAILHQVNCQGVMGSGIAKQVREKYPYVYQRYREFYESSVENNRPMLGSIQICLRSEINNNKQYIVNMFAQENYGRGNRFTDYDALQSCLSMVNKAFAGCFVAIPYLMSCDRGGGDWDVVDKLIRNTLIDCAVTYYRYNK